jgi:hypothetical protein
MACYLSADYRNISCFQSAANAISTTIADTCFDNYTCGTNELHYYAVAHKETKQVAGKLI